MLDKIIIRGARQHNLKNVNLEIPRNKLVVVTGLSGSGKSSLAFDTIYAERQRRYVQSLSAYARQFLGIMDKPDVDKIEGLSPAISIDQKTTSHNPRSTVGTVTEIYDYLRLLFANIGTPHCHVCGQRIAAQTQESMVEQILTLPANAKIMLLAPVVRDQKGEHRHILEELRKQGYGRVRFDGTFMDVAEAQTLRIDRKKKHTLEAVVDRISVTREERGRIAESLETALELGNDVVSLYVQDTNKEILLSLLLACPSGHTSLAELAPRNFSFNSPHGACADCTGLGSHLEVDASLVIPNPRLTLDEGAVRPWSTTTSRLSWYHDMLAELAKKYRFSLSVPAEKLPKRAVDIILYGEPSSQDSSPFEGVIPYLERRYRETDSDYIRSEIEQYMREKVCPSCKGARLRPEALSVRIAERSIVEVTAMPVEEAMKFFSSLPKHLSSRELAIAKLILKEIQARLEFLSDVGLSYLTLERSAGTLSGGEAQRIRLATQIGSGLTGVLYILDEPSIGLHPRDTERLLITLRNLRDLGNTVLVVEHDEDTILAADHVVDIGPGAGKWGGEVVASGTPEQLKKNVKSPTGRYLADLDQIPLPSHRRPLSGKALRVSGASEHNLKSIDIEIPLRTFVCVTGVSGSGKSTLVNDIIARALLRRFYQAKDEPGQHEKILGTEHLDKVVMIDQSPIGRTPRSNPATYTGVFTHVRDLFASLPESRLRGYEPGRFSFNVRGGRCEACAGEGVIKIEMHFLPDVYVMCEECKGQRYNREALAIHYKGKTISDILMMTVEEARLFFANVPSIARKLDTLSQVGLGYIQLGQSATTLSGGEAQRIKLATELSRTATGKTLYILDEPTTGLHFEDVKKLLSVLQQLVDKGNTVLVIEHNPHVVKCADWIIDLGPEGGNKGGEIIAEGSPEELVRVKRSYTGQFLRKYLPTNGRAKAIQTTSIGVGKEKKS